MLARRELFSVQLRERLARKGFSESEVDDAVERLQTDGALDDQRAAAAFAHDAAVLKMRSPRRTSLELGRLGISDTDAQAAVKTAYADTEERVLVARALGRRLSGRITGHAHYRRLYHALLRLGFDPAVVAEVLRAHSCEPFPSTDTSRSDNSTV